MRKNVEFFPQFSPNPKKIVVHSFRHTMSTLVNEERDDENNNVSISADDVERALAHKKPKMQKKYDKSKAEKTTRKVLTWWLSYLKSNGLELKFDMGSKRAIVWVVTKKPLKNPLDCRNYTKNLLNFSLFFEATLSNDGGLE